MTNTVRVTQVDGPETSTTIYIRGMKLVSKTEVRKALGREIAVESIIDVGELRDNAQNTKAVEVMVKVGTAERVLKDGRVRVGVSSCAIQKRIRVTSCRICLSYKHLAKDRKTGGDGEARCYRCNRLVHLARVLCRE